MLKLKSLVSFIILLAFLLFVQPIFAAETIDLITVKGVHGLKSEVIRYVGEEKAGGWKYVDKKHSSKSIPAFKDINLEHPDLPADALAAILRTAYHNIFGGYKDGKFEPQRHITRGEFITVVVRNFVEDYNTLLTKMNKKPYPAVGFKDMADHWARINVVIAKDRKWITGYKDNTFRPNSTITHAEALVILNNVALSYGAGSEFPYSFGERHKISLKDSTGKPQDKSEEEKLFKSEAVDSSTEVNYAYFFQKWEWAYPAIKNFAAEGIISYKYLVDREFYPSYKLTRAEAAVLLDAVNCHFERQRMEKE